MGNLQSLCSGRSSEADILLTSVAAGDVARTKQLLRTRPYLLTCRRADSTIWHAAAKAGQHHVLAQLIDFARSEVFTGLPDHVMESKIRQLLDACNIRGQTPLMLACKRGHVECVALLVKMGADTFSCDRKSELTAVHIAVKYGHASCVRAILDNISPEQAVRDRCKLQDACNVHGLAPLHFAVACGHLPCVEALLDYDVYLMPRAKAYTVETGMSFPNGSTPLHIAAERNDTEAAKAILRHHAVRMSRDARTAFDIRRLRDSHGSTPYQIARSRGHSAILVELLHTGTDLFVNFDIQDLAAPAAGVPKLSIIAAAALQLKLLSDVRRASAGSSAGLKTSATGLSHRDDDDGRSSDSERPLAGATSPSAGDAASCPGSDQVAVTIPAAWTLPADADAEVYDALCCSGSLLSDDVLAQQQNSEDEKPRQYLAVLFQKDQQVVLGEGLVEQQLQDPLGNLCPAATADVEDSAAAGENSSQAWQFAVKGKSDPAPGSSSGTVGPMAALGWASEDAVGLSSPGNGSDDYDRYCAVCFERESDVCVGGCEHKLCSTCAHQMCMRLADKPLACPFCRKSVGMFVSL